MPRSDFLPLFSPISWVAPLKVQVEMKTSGAGGIVNAFIFKGEGKTGDEVSSDRNQSMNRL